MCLYERGANTNFFKNSFTFKGTQDWNNLTKECRLLTSMCSFKNKLRSLFKKFYPPLVHVFSYVCEFHCFVHIGSQCLICIFLLLCIHVKCPTQGSQVDWPMANGSILLKIKNSFIHSSIRRTWIEQRCGAWPSVHCYACSISTRLGSRRLTE